MSRAQNHDDTVVDMIRNDPGFAEIYLHTAFEELDEDGGEAAFLVALRHVVEAKGGMAVIAEKSGLSRESLYRALSPRGNPTLRTMKQVIHAAGMKFAEIA